MDAPSGGGARYPDPSWGSKASTWKPRSTIMSAPTEAPRPKAVLVGVQLSGVTDAEQRSSLKEPKRLGETLGFEVVGEVTQKRKGLGAATLLGGGKLVELAAWTGGTGGGPKGPPSQKKAMEEEEGERRREGGRGGRGRPAGPRGAACAHRGAARLRCRHRPRAVASTAPQHLGRDLGRGGTGSHGCDYRDLPSARVEPTGAAASRDRAAHLCSPPVARDRRRRAPARRHRAEGRRRVLRGARSPQDSRPQ